MTAPDAPDWKRLSATISDDRAEPIGELLTDLGAVSVSLTAADDTTGEAIYEPPIGQTPAWKRSRITGLFSADTDLALTVAALANALANRPDGGPAIEWQADTLTGRAWERVWMDDFHPQRIGRRLWVCPSWQPPPDPDAVNLMMDPGLAFGSGTHPTTRLCLAWLDANIRGGEQLVDFGCGSGILAIAALRLGAAAATAVDIDPQAIAATLENAARNRVTDRLQAGLADTTQLPRTGLLLANILAGPLVELAPRLRDLVRPGGRIVLSGILASQAEQVAGRYADGFTLDPLAHDQEWVRISATRDS